MTKVAFTILLLVSAAVHGAETKPNVECEDLLPKIELSPLEQTIQSYQQLVARFAGTPVSSGASLAQKILRRNLESQLLAMGLSAAQVLELSNVSIVAEKEAIDLKFTRGTLVEEKWDASSSTELVHASPLQIYQPVQTVKPYASDEEVAAAMAIYHRLGPIDKDAYLAIIGNGGMPLDLRKNLIIRLMTDGFHHTSFRTTAEFRELLQDANGQLVLDMVGKFQDSSYMQTPVVVFQLPLRHRYIDLSGDTFNWQSPDQFILKTGSEKAAVAHRFDSIYLTVRLAYLHSHLLGDLLVKEVAQQLGQTQTLDLMKRRQLEAEQDLELYAGELEAADVVNSEYVQRFLVNNGHQSIKGYLQILLKQHVRDQIENSPNRRHIEPFFSRHGYDFDQIAVWLSENKSATEQIEKIQTLMYLLRLIPQFSGLFKARCNLPLRHAIHAQLASSTTFTSGRLAWVEKFWQPQTKNLNGAARLVFESDHAQFKMEVWRFKTKGMLEVRVQKVNDPRIHRFEAVEYATEKFWCIRELWRFQSQVRCFNSSDGFASFFFAKLSPEQQAMFRTHQSLGQLPLEVNLAYPTSHAGELTNNRHSAGLIHLQ